MMNFSTSRRVSRCRTHMLAMALCCLPPTANTAPDASALAESFASPPDTARPWVWAHWLHGNVDKPSITRQLESMKRVGLGGMTMFDVAQTSIPPGPHGYMQPSWQELFAHQIAEARRLGLEVMSHNGPGYGGNGGPWMPPELASQKIVESATRIPGGKKFSGTLPQPTANGGFYRDVAVLAINETDAQAKPRIENLDMKRLVWLNFIKWTGVISAPTDAKLPPEACIPRENVVNLTGNMAPDGKLEWDAPPGQWTILRFGHTWTGQKTLPATPEGEGPECDKLDKRGIQFHFNHVMKRLIELGGPASGKDKTFHTFFADSWEAGGQNWTEKMPAEFQRRRGYDIIPFLPVLTGRVLGDLQVSERFLYDLRLTVSELVTENFWAEHHRLCTAAGMRFAAEPYITTGNDIDAANHMDEPMGEFWTAGVSPVDYRITVKLAASAANLNGRLRVGAEAFTANHTERWLSHPAKLKSIADQILCLGVNRFQVHRFAMQRFPNLKPGMMMGGWGQQYDYTQTWWEWSRPWHNYLARCQFLLSQGPVVTDVLALTPEEPLWRFEHHPVPGHDYDACGPDNFRKITMLPDGKPGLPGGPSYHLITVNHTGTMSLARLRQLMDLVKNGASILGEPPLATPGLEDFPNADATLKKLAAELWGTGNEQERRIGKGRVFRGISPADALARLGVPRDFSSPAEVSWIHRTAGDADVYFLASAAAKPTDAACTFRVSGKHAELWDPLTGATRPLATSPSGDGLTSAIIPLPATGSTFVVFRPGTQAAPVTPAAATASVTPPESLPLKGKWTLVLPGESGIQKPIALDSLLDWSQHPDPKVRHFSGTAVYTTTFDLPASKTTVHLDLGRVEVMAKVRVNHEEFPVSWLPPHVIDITKAAKAGKNTLVIAVVNLWPNRLIGDEHLPPDSAAERDPKNGRLHTWPKWVLEGKPSPTGRQSFVTFPLWKKSDPLQPSGLLGPVQLVFR